MQNKKITARIVYKGIIGLFAVSLILVINIQTSTGLNQNSYRWRNDDGNEASATFAGAENTPLKDLVKDTLARLRFTVDGTGNSSNSFQQVDHFFSATQSNFDINPTAIDAAGGYAYFGTHTNWGNEKLSWIFKINLTTHLIEDTLLLEPGDGPLSAAAINTADGYLYFGTSGYPASIVKIRLSDFSRVDRIDFPEDENSIGTLLVDPGRGYLYAAMDTNPGKIVRVRLSDFTRQDVLNGPFNYYWWGVMDSAGFAYFAANSGAHPIMKVDLDTFTVVATTTPSTTANFLNIDTDNGYLYASGFSKPPPTYTSRASITKIRLSDLSQVGTLVLDVGQTEIAVGALDTSAGYGYFAQEGPGATLVAKVDLNTFTEVGTLQLNAQQDVTYAEVLDPVRGFIYFGNITSYYPSNISVVDTSTFTEVTNYTLELGGKIDTLAIDSAGGFAYVSVNMDTGPDQFWKIRLSDMTKVATTTNPHAAGRVALIDKTGGYAYFASASVINKLDLNTLNIAATTSITTAIDGNLDAGIINEADHSAYFGTGSSPAKIIKYNLYTMTRLATTTLSVGNNNVDSAFYDPGTGFAYFSLGTSPAKIVKFNMATMEEVATLTLAAGENIAYASDIDTINGYAYIGLDTSPGKVAKIDLATFTEAGPALNLNVDENYSDQIYVDAKSQYAYVIPYRVYNAGKGVIQIDLKTFTRASSLALPAMEYRMYSGAIDRQTGHIYSISSDYKDLLAKISLPQRYSYQLEYGLKTATCSAVSNWTEIPAATSTGPWQLATSSNFSEGQATTNVAGGLSDPGGFSFVAGETRSTSSKTSALALNANQFTELEYGLKATTNAADGATYCFRLTDAGSDMVYARYAEATIAGEGSGGEESGNEGEAPPPSPPSSPSSRGGSRNRFCALFPDHSSCNPILPNPVTPPIAQNPKQDICLNRAEGLVPASGVFERDLKPGDQGTNALYLQKFLNANGFILGKNGAGSPGFETEHFAGRTAQSLKDFQITYKSYIETYFGQIKKLGWLDKPTRDFLNNISQPHPDPADCKQNIEVPLLPPVASDTEDSPGQPVEDKPDDQPNIIEPKQASGGTAGSSGSSGSFISRTADRLADIGRIIQTGTLNAIEYLPAADKLLRPANITLTAIVVAAGTTVQFAGTINQAFSGLVAFSDAGPFATRALFALMTFIGVRKKRRYWGTVYDSKTKQPIDPAIVSLIDVDTGQIAEQCVSDLAGRFGFLARTGTFRITAAKTHYQFPSKEVTGSNDEIFDNLYHGEAFTIADISQVVAPNIPMDPLAFDWNQENKKQYVEFHPRRDHALSILMNLIFWIGFAAALIMLIAYPTGFNALLAASYVVILAASLFLSKLRLWGRVLDSASNSIPGLLLELKAPSLSTVILGRAKTAPDGKFFLKATPGDYILHIKKRSDAGEEELSERPVSINDTGILNRDVVV